MDGLWVYNGTELSLLFGDDKNPAEESWTRPRGHRFQSPFFEKNIELFLENLNPSWVSGGHDYWRKG